MTISTSRRAATIAVTVISLIAVFAAPAAASSVKPNSQAVSSTKAGPDVVHPDTSYCAFATVTPYLASGDVVGDTGVYCTPTVPSFSGWYKVWRKKSGFTNVLVGMVTLPAPSSPNQFYYHPHVFGACTSGWTYWLHDYATDGFGDTLDVNSSNVILC